MKRSPDALREELHALRCELAGEVLGSSGRVRLQVMGWSMLPTIFPGDTVLIERATSECVSKGDIVLFRRARRLFVHRVSGMSDSAGELQIITQGDGMARPDPPISGSQLLGKVSFIVRDGRCVKPAKTLGLAGRALASLARSCASAARVIVGVYKIGRGAQESSLC